MVRKEKSYTYKILHNNETILTRTKPYENKRTILKDFSS